MSTEPSCCAGGASRKIATPVLTGVRKPKKQVDLIFWGSLAIVAAGYGWHLLSGGLGGAMAHDGAHRPGFSDAIFELMNQMWIGIVMGIVAMGFMSRVPREFIIAALGTRKGMHGVVRATVAGVLLDLCSHGILMVGAKLYERGATVGQLMAFLLASPWNSLSLTLILISLIGLKWTLLFIALSAVIGIVTGTIFDLLVERGTLPANPNRQALPEGFRFWPAAKAGLAKVKWTPAFLGETLKIGLGDSKMILRWLFVGVIIAAALRVFVDPENFRQFFGPSLIGLGITLFAATVIEVCSEGSAPIAGDIINRAGAVGNGFTFMMAGVATDYTEIMVLREATKSWKIALFLPLLTVPQVLALGWVLNQFAP